MHTVFTSATPTLQTTPAPRVVGLMLLAGRVSPSPLRSAAGRPTFELPICNGKTVLDLWTHQSSLLAEAGGESQLSLQVLLELGAEVPRSLQSQADRGAIVITHDHGEIRGAGGALRDATLSLSEDAYVLAVPAGQVALVPLPQIVRMLVTAWKGDADAVLVANADGTPGTVLLARVGALRRIPAVGFVDLKEQALPLLARHGVVRVRRVRVPMAVSVRTPMEYLRALRLLSDITVTTRTTATRRAAFSLVEPGADVDPTATLHDSVVLAGATVGERAVLVRCVVGPGGVVPPGGVSIDTMLVARSGSPVRAKGSSVVRQTASREVAA